MLYKKQLKRTAHFLGFKKSLPVTEWANKPKTFAEIHRCGLTLQYEQSILK